MPDHVHLLVEVDPQFGIHKFVKLVKGRSSRFLRQEFPRLRSRLPKLLTLASWYATQERMHKREWLFSGEIPVRGSGSPCPRD